VIILNIKYIEKIFNATNEDAEYQLLRHTVTGIFTFLGENVLKVKLNAFCVQRILLERQEKEIK